MRLVPLQSTSGTQGTGGLAGQAHLHRPAEHTGPALISEAEAEAGALARATVNLFRQWALTDAEARVLLGDMSARTWARWKDGAAGRIDRDLRLRMAILMGIHKGLRYLFRDPARGYAWVRKPNAAFDGLSALEVMLRGEITDLMDLRAYLDAERGA